MAKCKAVTRLVVKGLIIWQVKEEKSSSDVNLDIVKNATPGLPGRAYSYILIARNVDQWRYCIELPEHDTAVQSTFRSQFQTVYFSTTLHFK